MKLMSELSPLKGDSAVKVFDDHTQKISSIAEEDGLSSSFAGFDQKSQSKGVSEQRRKQSRRAIAN